jgi:hypothetical protein
MAGKQRLINVMGMSVPVDDDGCFLIWPVIVELFKNNEENLLSDAQIAQVVSRVCKTDFEAQRVRIYRHKYNRGDYSPDKKPPEVESRAISRCRQSRIDVEKVQSLRTLFKMQQSRPPAKPPEV